MKKTFIAIVLLVVFTSSCGKAQSSPTAFTPTLTWPPSATQTPAASNTPTPTPLIARDGTPPPFTGEGIAPSNIHRMVEVARWGNGDPQHRLLSSDEKTLFVQTDIYITSYDVNSKEVHWQFEVPVGITSLAMSEPANTVAVGDDEGNIWLLRADSGDLIKTWHAHDAAAYYLFFSPNGDLLASQSEGTIIWRLPEAKKLYNFDEYDYGAFRTVLTEDRLAAGNSIFDLTTGKTIFQGKFLLAVFPEANLFLVSNGPDLTLRSLETGDEVMNFTVGEDKYAGAAAISNDHMRITVGYFGYEDNYYVGAIEWDITSGHKLHTFKLPITNDFTSFVLCAGDGGGPYDVYEVQYSTDGNELKIVTGFYEDVYWNIANGTWRIKKPAPNPALQLPYGRNDSPLNFSPDGQWLVSGENLWSISSGESKVFEDQDLLGVSSDGKSLFSYQYKKILEYALPGFGLLNTTSLGPESRDECSEEKVMSPDGSLFFEGGVSGYGSSYSAYMWELDRKVSDWFELQTEDDQRSVVFSADGKQMVVTSFSLGVSRPAPDLTIYDVSTGELLFGAELHGNYLYKAALSGDGNTLAALTDNKLWVWNLADPQEEPIEISVAEDWPSEREELTLSPRGDLVAAHTPHSISIWDAITGELLAEIEFAQRYTSVYDLKFSPDGRYLATVTGDGIVRLWGVPDN